MRVSLFKIGVVLVIAGSIWMGVIFSDNVKASDDIVLKKAGSAALDIEFVGSGIAYYTIHVDEYSGQEIFLQILDGRGNVIDEELVKTRMSVGYFDYTDGVYSIQVTDISDTPVYGTIELGDTNSRAMIPAGLLVLIGCITIMIMSFLKIKNYSIAQPDENS